MQRTGQSDQFKMVKPANFKFDVHSFLGHSRHDPFKIFRKEGVCKNSLGRDMHSHEHLLAIIVVIVFVVFVVLVL